jgi:hypothetical protein
MVLAANPQARPGKLPLPLRLARALRSIDLPSAKPHSRAICFSFIGVYLIILRSISPH